MIKSNIKKNIKLSVYNHYCITALIKKILNATKPLKFIQK